MIPSLQRFYGGTWREWLEIPERIFTAYVRMMPIIQARESLQRTAETRLGMGPKTKQDERWHKSTHRKWVAMASECERKSAGKGGAAFRMNMAAAGIPIVVVPKKKKGKADGR